MPPKDINALKDAVEYILDNHQNYFLERIAQHANERYGYDTLGRILDSVYKEVAAK